MLGARCIGVGPYPTRMTAPVYPDIALEAHVDGTVVLDALVCEHGRVVDARKRKSIPMLDAAAIECVLHWTFLAAHDSSHAYSCWTEVPVKFTLR